MLNHYLLLDLFRERNLTILSGSKVRTCLLFAVFLIGIVIQILSEFALKYDMNLYPIYVTRIAPGPPHLHCEQ